MPRKKLAKPAPEGPRATVTNLDGVQIRFQGDEFSGALNKDTGIYVITDGSGEVAFNSIAQAEGVVEALLNHVISLKG